MYYDSELSERLSQPALTRQGYGLGTARIVVPAEVVVIKGEESFVVKVSSAGMCRRG